MAWLVHSFYDWDLNIPAVTAPVLVVTGSDDRFIVPRISRAVAAIVGSTDEEAITERLSRSDLPEAAFCQWLTSEIGVAAIPLSAFYADGFDQRVVRFCFAKKDETLKLALSRLARL